MDVTNGFLRDSNHIYKTKWSWIPYP